MPYAHSALPGISNRLLDALPDAERARLLGRFDPVELAFGQCLLQPGGRLDDVYFPMGGYVSLMLPLPRRGALEVGLIGNDSRAVACEPFGPHPA
ncbi:MULTISPECIES: hypothetical protein [Achromobacter]|uniref:Cyclic nucleotide-binding domain-containing protein n=1 Tax=Achromobacter spanius TaxID=217203 RepID=A0ABY8GXD1_9BURK|nr:MULTISPECIES: hypothetical protein [Achromobacter]WAI81578.1 hypothetical protein N8Z00_18790 [Achromobacter spanius]WEX97095.1 hypothetical protein N3Z32_13395 [Achromobacter sp. SS2-2022]WFP09188.1 hypothetical protein P8T11_04715 [Achromobacter spanius]